MVHLSLIIFDDPYVCQEWHPVASDQRLAQENLAGADDGQGTLVDLISQLQRSLDAMRSLLLPRVERERQ